MSKDANNSVAAGGKENRNALLVGLLLLLLLILAPLYWVERAQQDLTERSRAALRNGGLDPDAFEVGFDGRDARLVGSQAEAAQLSQARRLVQQVWGVRTISTRATAANTGTPTSSAASQTSKAALGGGSEAAPTGDSPAQPPAAEQSQQTAAGLDPASTPPPSPRPTAVAPQAEEVSVVEASASLRGAEPASEPAATESFAAETVAETTVAPVSEAQTTRPPITPGPEIPDRAMTAGRESAEPAQSEAQTLAETGPAEPAPEAAPETAEINREPKLPAANTAAEKTGTPAPKETSRAPEPLAQATASAEADHEPPEPESEPIPDPTATPLRDDSGATVGLDADALLVDWPDLAAVEDLRVEMQHGQVWLRGQVNSSADLERIEIQFPDSAAGRHVRLDLQLATRSSQELAEYLNLLAASFRFRSGTSHFGPAGERAMDRIADTLKSYPGIRLGLAGLAPETIKPEVRRVHARHRAGATYRALLKRGVNGRQLFLADFANPFSPLLSRVPVAPSGPGQIQFFSLER